MEIEFWFILCLVLGIAAFFLLKVLIQEIVHYGLKGLFVFLPKVVYRILKKIVEFIGDVFKVFFYFLKCFFKALKICIKGV